MRYPVFANPPAPSLPQRHHNISCHFYFYECRSLFLRSRFLSRSTLLLCIFASKVRIRSSSAFFSLDSLIRAMCDCLIASFSAFSSRSRALAASISADFAARCAKALLVDLCTPRAERNGVLLMCQCLPKARVKKRTWPYRLRERTVLTHVFINCLSGNAWNQKFCFFPLCDPNRSSKRHDQAVFARFTFVCIKI